MCLALTTSSIRIATVGRTHLPTRRLIWIHGNDLSGDFYRPAAEQLAEQGFQSDLLTLPGFDDVPPYATPSWSLYTDELLRTYTELCPDGGVLVGHSLGTIFAAMLAARQPTGMRGLVLVESSFPAFAWIARRMAHTYTTDVVDGPRDAFTNWTGTARRIADPARFPSNAMRIYLDARAQCDPTVTRDLLAQIPEVYPFPFHTIAAPTLLLRGRASGWRMALLQILLRWRLRHARMVTLPDTGHWVFNEADAAATEAMARFCNELKAPDYAAG